jgi:hypothetical protein
MLVGEPLNTDQLSADDNTRCGSMISDVRIEVTYTAPPVAEQYNPEKPR